MSAPLDPVEIVEEWLNLAQEDLATATDMVPRHRWRHVCFHAQQAAEKFIKALLMSRQIEIPRTHDFEKLMQRLADAKSLGLLDPDILDLSEYAVDTRYPKDSVEALAADDAERALVAAKKVEERVMNALRPPN
jgi:HEPN domain-containing protein